MAKKLKKQTKTAELVAIKETEKQRTQLAKCLQLDKVPKGTA